MEALVAPILARAQGADLAVLAARQLFALLAPALPLAVATAATSPPPSALREQTNTLMTLVGRVVAAAA